ncbi:MAG: glyoxalase [Terriglobia bacterium]|nr:MAG: glyoxalase [Terriglobia bacterium]
MEAATARKRFGADSEIRDRNAKACTKLQCLYSERSRMPKKIDPLNKKQYGAVSVAITVADIKAAANFYQKALGFTKRGMMNGPDKKPIHAELRLRDTTLMLGPENPAGGRSAKTLGGSPVTLYLLTENSDKVVAKAVKLGATLVAPVSDRFWGDRVGIIADPDGNTWMIATHTAELAPQEMNKKMKEEIQAQAAAQPAVGA